MVMDWIFTGLVGIAVVAALILGNGSALAAAIPQGAQAGITLAVSIAGALCLWSGIGKLLEKTGFTALLARLFKPVLYRLFPSSKENVPLQSALSANICANILGLGNAATPMGIQAARLLHDGSGKAGAELCRLVVLNTASIQLIPGNVAALRAALGCSTPFDILPAVWLTGGCSVLAGLGAAFLLGRLWKK